MRTSEPSCTCGGRAWGGARGGGSARSLLRLLGENILFPPRLAAWARVWDALFPDKMRQLLSAASQGAREHLCNPRPACPRPARTTRYLPAPAPNYPPPATAYPQARRPSSSPHCAPNDQHQQVLDLPPPLPTPLSPGSLGPSTYWRVPTLQPPGPQRLLQ